MNIATATWIQSAVRLPDAANGESPSETQTFPGWDVTKDHFQASQSTTTSALMIQNTDANKSIVLHAVTCSHGKQISGGQQYNPVAGTLAASGSGGDILVFAGNLYGPEYLWEGPVVLPRATNLVCFTIMGPGTGGGEIPSFSVNMNYEILEDVTPTVEVTPETDYSGGGDDGGGDPGGAPPPSGGR